MIPLGLHPEALGIAAASSVIIGLAGALLPALRALRLPIVDALRLAD